MNVYISKSWRKNGNIIYLLCSLIEFLFFFCCVNAQFIFVPVTLLQIRLSTLPELIMKTEDQLDLIKGTLIATLQANVASVLTNAENQSAF